MKKSIALYDPYLDTLGGGEKHILSILKVLNEEGFEINIFWDTKSKSNINQQLLIRFNIKLDQKFLPNIFQKKISFIEKFIKLKQFDIFFYVTDGSYFFSGAKKNFVFCMVPQKNLYQMNLLNKLKTLNYKFISNSKYTHDWLEKWGIKNDCIHPYIDDAFFSGNKIAKKKIILSVGRFFAHLHTKQHETTISAFKKIKEKHKEMQDYQLILVGGLKKEDMDYFNKLKNLIKDCPSIILNPNINFNELHKLYKFSAFYWHFAGFAVDEQKQPEAVEHLGITPLEAMASGCLTYCYNAGGPKEIIKDGVNGFLFNSEEELINKTLFILNNSQLQNKILSSAKNFVKNNFSYPIFKERVKKIIL